MTHRRALLAVLATAMLIDALEVSTTVIALPSIAAGLRLPVADAQWVMSGFALGFGGMLLLGGRVADLTGRRGVYLAALACYAILCGAGGLAGNAAALVATRIGRGCCAALTAPAGLAIIVSVFPAGRARNRAIAVYSAFGASGFTAGLLLSGILTEVQWRWTIVFPAPVAVVLLAAGWWLIPGAEATAPAPGGAGPGLPPARLARDGTLIRSAVAAAALNGSYWGLLLLSTFRLQDDQGWAPLTAALAMLPASVPPLLAAPFGTALTRRWPPRMLVFGGLLAATAGYAVAAAFPPPSGYLTGLLPAFLLVGLGYVGAFSALHLQALSGVPAPLARAATSMYQAFVQFGGAFVLIVLAALIASRERPFGQPAAGAAHAIAAGYGPATTLITAVSAIGAATAAAGLIPIRWRSQ